MSSLLSSIFNPLKVGDVINRPNTCSQILEITPTTIKYSIGEESSYGIININEFEIVYLKLLKDRYVKYDWFHSNVKYNHKSDFYVICGILVKYGVAIYNHKSTYYECTISN